MLSEQTPREVPVRPVCDIAEGYQGQRPCPINYCGKTRSFLDIEICTAVSGHDAEGQVAVDDVPRDRGPSSPELLRGARAAAQAMRSDCRRDGC